MVGFSINATAQDFEWSAFEHYVLTEVLGGESMRHPFEYGFGVNRQSAYVKGEPKRDRAWIVANNARTNSAAFIAWRASQPDAILAAELQQLSASLDALVFLELGEHIDGTDEQLARLSAFVVSSLESNRIEYAAAETLAELKAAGARINNLRSIISLQTKIVSLRE